MRYLYYFQLATLSHTRLFSSVVSYSDSTWPKQFTDYCW